MDPFSSLIQTQGVAAPIHQQVYAPGFPIIPASESSPERRNKLTYAFDNARKAIESCRQLRLHIENLSYHMESPEVGPFPCQGYGDWKAMQTDLTDCAMEIQKALVKTFHPIAFELYGVKYEGGP